MTFLKEPNLWTTVEDLHHFVSTDLMFTPQLFYDLFKPYDFVDSHPALSDYSCPTTTRPARKNHSSNLGAASSSSASWIARTYVIPCGA